MMMNDVSVVDVFIGKKWSILVRMDVFDELVWGRWWLLLF